MANQSDLRVVRSKKMIKAAFLTLIEEKGYETMTIKDIADKAMVNRKTFYLHYDSKLTLFQEIVVDAIALLLKDMHYERLERGQKNIPIDLDREIQTVMHNILANKELFRVLFMVHANYELADMMKVFLRNSVFSKITLADLTPEASRIPSELLFEVVTSIFISIIKWLVLHAEHSEDDAKEIFISLITTEIVKFVSP